MEYDLVFWVIDVNLHLSSLFCSLGEKRKVLVIAQKYFNEDRKKDGWFVPSLGSVDLIVEPSETIIKDCIDNNKEAVHVFLGIDAFEIVYKGFKYAVSKKIKIGVISESGINIGLSGKLRRIKFLIRRIQYGRDINFILAMGYLGVKWFNKSLYPNDKLYPFLYVVPTVEINAKKPLTINNKAVSLIVIAQCIERKNISLLLKSLSVHKDLLWNLTVIGEGYLKQNLIDLAAKLEIQNRVNFLGTIPYNQVRSYLNNSDICILPSKWDGSGSCCE